MVGGDRTAAEIKRKSRSRKREPGMSSAYKTFPSAGRRGEINDSGSEKDSLNG